MPVPGGAAEPRHGTVHVRGRLIPLTKGREIMVSQACLDNIKKKGAEYCDTINPVAPGQPTFCGEIQSEISELCKQHSYRSEEHTSELQSLMRISYAVFCLKKKTNIK